MTNPADGNIVHFSPTGEGGTIDAADTQQSADTGNGVETGTAVLEPDENSSQESSEESSMGAEEAEPKYPSHPHHNEGGTIACLPTFDTPDLAYEWLIENCKPGNLIMPLALELDAVGFVLLQNSLPADEDEAVMADLSAGVYLDDDAEIAGIRVVENGYVATIGASFFYSIAELDKTATRGIIGSGPLDDDEDSHGWLSEASSGELGRYVPTLKGKGIVQRLPEAPDDSEYDHLPPDFDPSQGIEITQVHQHLGTIDYLGHKVVAVIADFKYAPKPSEESQEKAEEPEAGEIETK